MCSRVVANQGGPSHSAYLLVVAVARGKRALQVGLASSPQHLMPHFDPRDTGTPFTKEWHEFQAAYASARLQGWLLSELEEISPSYFQDLRNRIGDAIIHGEGFKDEGDDDPAAPIQSPSGHGVCFWDLEDAYTLEQQLFPFWEPQGDFGDFARGLVVVGLHAALDAYGSALRIGKGHLPTAIEKALGSRGQQLDAETYRSLVTADAVRHLYAHTRGVVDDSYVNRVPANNLRPGERRPVTETDLERFAQTIWKVGVKLRDAFAAG